jgi:hypothetical protein
VKKLLILCGLLMSGCVKDGPNTTDFKEWLLACPNPFEAHPDGPVIARGGDVVVRASEFRRWVQGTTGGRIPVDIPVETRRRVLDQVLYRKVVTKIGKEAGVQMNPLALQTVENLQFTYLMSALIHSLPASDEEMRSYYHLHAKEILPSEVLVSRILLKSLAQAQKAQALLKKGRPAPGLLKDQFSPTDRGRMDPEVARVIFAL